MSYSTLLFLKITGKYLYRISLYFKVAIPSIIQYVDLSICHPPPKVDTSTCHPAHKINTLTNNVPYICKTKYVDLSMCDPHHKVDTLLDVLLSHPSFNLSMCKPVIPMTQYVDHLSTCHPPRKVDTLLDVLPSH